MVSDWQWSFFYGLAGGLIVGLLGCVIIVVSND